MKIAVLILAHKNPGQLRKLVDMLKTDFEVFIHFDSRSKDDQLFPDEEHVHILKKRYAPYWGSINSVLGMLELFKTAYSHNCDYYMVVSGQDMPLMSNQEIRNKIEKEQVSYIYNCPLPREGWLFNGGIDRLTLYWETKFENNAKIPHFFFLPYRAFFALLRQLQLKLNLKRPLSFSLWGGSQWINITKEAAAYILDFTNKNPWYIKRYRFTRLSDEIFFQTLLLGFDFPAKDKIVNDDMRFIDWTSGPQYPRLFVLDDYQRCINSGKLFARKFDEKVDNNIIDKIVADTHTPK